jgi:ABC-2 type transport system permease protein
MNKTWLVMRNEIITQIGRRSWLLTTIGLPLVLALVLFGRSLLTSGTPSLPSEPVGGPGQGDEIHVTGYVDLSNLIKTVPEELDPTLVAFPDEASACQALSDGDIAGYFLIPADFVAVGDLLYIDPEFLSFGLSGADWPMRWTVLLNLLGGDRELAQEFSEPMELQPRPLAGETRREVGMGWEYWIPYGTAMVLYVVIIMSSSLLRHSLGQEQKNRVMEVLISSVTPEQLLAGKLLALAIVGLLQTLIWGGTSYLLMRLGGQSLQLPPEAPIPVTLVVWAAVFFLLGYGMYATLLAGLGALSGPNQMGTSTADFVIIWPMIIPLFFMFLLIAQPNSAPAVALSLLPPTAPVAMITRLASGAIPFWQPLLAAGLMAVTVWMTIRAVARVFRAQLLLSGQSFSLQRYLTALLGRV